MRAPGPSRGNARSRYTHEVTPEEFRHYGHELVDWLAGYMTRIRDYPVAAQVQPGQLTGQLPASAPEGPQSMDAIFADFQKLVLPAVTHWNHPRFHAYFAVSGAPEGILGELLTAGLNVNGMLWKGCPAATELELVTASWLRQWLGLPPDFFGMIHDTASTGMVHVLGAARQFAFARLPGVGQSEFVLYCSEQAHSSIEKAAVTIGLAHDQVRKVGLDARYRMDPEQLEVAMQADIVAGRHPFCAVATCGTTPTAALDPIAAIADVTQRHSVWLHVDAAYGGSAAISESHRHVLDGAERAHSVIVNPHKWLLTPVDLSLLYTQRPDLLREAFSLVPEYLRTEDDPRVVNLMDFSVALGRRFRALKLWFVMRARGRRWLASMIENHCRWARELASWIEADPRFEVAAPVELSLVCFRHRGGDEASRALLEAINADGFAFLSHTVLDGRFVLRFAIGNYQTTREDVRSVWESLQSLAG
jgi:aromatic-L-amino-acid decarboxylase